MRGGAVRGACEEVETALEGEGVKLAKGSPDGAIRVLVGPGRRCEPTPPRRRSKPDRPNPASTRSSNATAANTSWSASTPDGAAARRFGGDAGLVAATRRLEAPPVWVVTGATPAGVQSAAGLLDSGDLRDHYAVASEGGEVAPLPVR